MITIYSDGGARGNPGPAASAFAIYKDKEVLLEGSKYLGETTNNVAEYSGVILALEEFLKTIPHTNEKIVFKMDSELVVKQLTGVYKIKNKDLMTLAAKVKSIVKESNLNIEWLHIPRSENSLSDKLVNKKLDDSSRH